MYLKTIKSSRFKNRIYLQFSDNFVLPFFVDDYVIFKLKKGQEIDSALLLQLINKSVTYLLKNHALRQLGMSPRTKNMISQKLSLHLNTLLIKYKLPGQLINKNGLISEVIDYLDANRLLNESAYVEYFVKKNSKKPRRFLEYQLKAKGIDTTPYSELFPQTDSEIDNAKSLINKKYPSLNLSNYQNKNKIIASLYRKGFSLSVIKAAIDDLLKSR